MPRHILLDIHGTICDFVGGLIHYHELPNNTIDYWPKGEYDLIKTVGIGVSDPDHTIEFWTKLPCTEEIDLFWALSSIIPTTLITRAKTESNYMGVARWVSRNFVGPRLIITGDLKANYFDDHSIACLIDDSDEEIEAWRGPKILVPRPWNSGVGDPTDTVIRGISDIFGVDI